MKEGIIDGVGGLAETLKYIADNKLTVRVGPGLSGRNAYGDLKREMWRETVLLLDNWGAESNRDLVVETQLADEALTREKRVAAWEGSKSKL